MINALKSIFAVIISFSAGLEALGRAFALCGTWTEKGMQNFVDQAEEEREIARIQSQARLKVAKARALSEAKAQLEIKEVKEA